MAVKDTFSLKFTSDGLSDVLKSSEKVRLSYEDWIQSAEESIKKANRLSEDYADNQEKLAEAEELKAKAAKTATRTIAQSYRELGVKSSKSVENQKKRAISAFEAIKRSGVASAEDIERAEKALQKRLAQLDSQLDDTSGGMRTLGKEADRTGGEFTILKGAIAGTIANLATGLIQKTADGLFSLGRSAIATRTEFSKLRDQIALLEGGEVEGKTVFDRLQQFNTRTPFELREVTQAYITLANRGVKPTNDQLEALGDLALAQNKPLQQVIEAVADVSNSERFREFGINSKKVGDNVELTFKGITKTVKATEAEVLNAVVAFGELDGISGNIAKASNRLDGVGSNIADSMAGIQDTIGGIFEPLLVAGGKFLVDVIGPLSNPENWTPLTESFGILSSSMGELIPGVDSVTDAVANGLQFAVEAVADIVRSWAGFISENKDLLIELGNTIYQSAGAAFKTLVDSARELAQNLKDNPQLLNAFLARIGDAVIALGSLAKLALKIVTLIGKVALSLGSANEASKGWLGNTALIGVAFAGMVKFVAAISATVAAITAAAAAAAPILTGIVGIVTGIGAVIAGVFTIVATGIAGVIAAIGAVPIAVVAAIVIIGGLVYKFRDEIGAAFQALWKWISDKAVEAWETIVSNWIQSGYVIQDGLRELANWWEKIKAKAVDAWEFLKRKAGESLDFIQKKFDLLLKPLGEVKKIGGDIGNAIKNWGNPLKKATGLLNKFKEGFINILGLGKDVGTDVGKKIESKVGEGGPLLPAPEGAFHPSKFPVTSGFGMRNGRLHAGVDYGTPQGTALGNIFGAGTVTIAGPVGGYGNLIELTLDNGDVYRFGHMSRIMVRPGQRVPAGALMGLTGGEPGTPGAGRSTGPHLHLEHYPGGGGPVPFGGNHNHGGPLANDIRPFTRGRGGPSKKKTSSAKAKSEPKIVKVNLGGTEAEVEIVKKDSTQRVEIQAEIKSARETLDKALTELGIKGESESDRLEREIRDDYERITNTLDDAEEKYKLIIAVKAKLNEKTDDEKKALEEIEKARASANTQMDAEIRKTSELLSLQAELTRSLNRAENLETLAGVESEIDNRRTEQAVKSGRLSTFDADRLRIQRRIVEENAAFNSEIARLKLERTKTDDDEQIRYIDQLIERYTELNKVSLQDLTIELDDVAKAQREASRILPNSQELAANITGTLREIPQLIKDVGRGAKSFGDAVLGLLGSLAERLGSLFLDKGFNALEGILGGLFGGGKKKQGGGGGFLGKLIGAGVGVVTGGGGSGATSALNFDATPVFASRGGLIRGPGTSTSDSINARLSNNEYVINASSVRAVGVPTLEHINSQGRVPQSRSGGNTVVFNVTAEDAGSFRKTERQMHSAAVAELQKFR